jgi:hypothetical protein
VSASVGAGLLLGLVSAGAIGGGFALQHAEAAALPRLSARRPLRSLLALGGRPRWCTGFALGVAGWAAYVAGLRLAPLSLVQAASAGGVVVLAFAGRRPRGRELVGVAAALAGLVLLGLSLASGTGGGSASPLALGLWLGISGIAATLAAGPFAGALLPGAGLGAAAGLLYATADVATKEATSGSSGLALVPVVLGASALAFAALQLSFQRGGRLETAGLATLWTNALPIVAGSVVFREPFPAGPAGVVRGAAFCLTVAGGVVLARGGRDEHTGRVDGLSTGSLSSLTDESIPGPRRAERSRWQRSSRAAQPGFRSR